MSIVQWAVGGALLLLGAFIASFGYLRLLQNARNQAQGVDHHVSGVPLIGPLLFIMGWKISPLAWSWWVLGIVLYDLDTGLLVLALPFILLLRRGAQQPRATSTEGDEASKGTEA